MAELLVCCRDLDVCTCSKQQKPAGRPLSLKREKKKKSKAEEMGRTSLNHLRTHNTSSSPKEVDKWQLFSLKVDDFCPFLSSRDVSFMCSSLISHKDRL